MAVDIGGTFTDVVALRRGVRRASGQRRPRRHRPISPTASSPPSTPGAIDPAAVAAFVHGTTVVINAITQRSGVKTALVTTAGFRDVLEIGRGNRPDMYNLKFHKPRPFVPRRLRFEVRERVGADGSVWTPLATEDLEAVVDRLSKRRAWRPSPICFLHAYAHPAHEAGRGGVPARAAARCAGHRLVRDHPRVARVRAQQHGRPQRLRAADSGRLSRRSGEPTADGGVDRAALRHALQRRHGHVRGRPARRRSPWSSRDRSPASPARRSSARHRRRQHHRPRHRGHHGEVLVDRGRRGEDHDRLPVGGERRALLATR